MTDLTVITCECGHREQLHAHPNANGDRWCAGCQKFCPGSPEHTTTRARKTPLVNLRRLTECSLCERLTPVRGNVKLYGDERDAAALCAWCVASCLAHADLERERREQSR